MRLLRDEEAGRAEEHLRDALTECDHSPCLSSQSGCIIVNSGLVIGRGTNSPPGHMKLDASTKDNLPDSFRSDRTCCIHAEQRAILDAYALQPELLRGATLYYIRKKNGEQVFAGKPYCTICSKLALDVGIREFVLWHEYGIVAYEAKEYNDLSFSFVPE